MGKLRTLAAGAAGGIAGAAIMAPLHGLGPRLTGKKTSLYDDPTVKVANAVVSKLTGRRIPYSKRKLAGTIVHFAFAAGIGALYALLAEDHPRLAKGAGVLMGSAMYGGAHSLAVPALGLSSTPVKNGLVNETCAFAAHLAYGTVTDAVRRVLS
jgi:putative membrane protein